jgi:hypothetical protein
VDAGVNIIGVHKIPLDLRRASVRKEDIIEWARRQLMGQEPALTNSEVDQIREGNLETIFLRPRRPGFFLPDGTFVEAFDYSPEFGEDLKVAATRWDVEEADRAWADQENSLFNKSAASGSPRFTQLMWEHGRRIAERSEERKVSPSRFLILLDKRSRKDSYRRHTHQTALDFFRWIPSLESASRLFSWRWERLDCVIRFSSVNSVRDCVTNVLESTRLGRLHDDQLSRLLGVKSRKRDFGRTIDEEATLNALRALLKKCHVPSPELTDQAIEIVTSQTREGESPSPDEDNAG